MCHDALMHKHEPRVQPLYLMAGLQGAAAADSLMHQPVQTQKVAATPAAGGGCSWGGGSGSIC